MAISNMLYSHNPVQLIDIHGLQFANVSVFDSLTTLLPAWGDDPLSLGERMGIATGGPHSILDKR